MFQVSSRKGVQGAVPKIARLLSKYGAPFLQGNEEAFRGAFAMSSERAKSYWRKFELEELLTRAETAWRAKDYATYTRLLLPVRQELGEVQNKRLAYAERKMRI